MPVVDVFPRFPHCRLFSNTKHMVSINDYSYYSLRIWDPIIWFGFIKIIKTVLLISDVVLSSVFGYSVLTGSSAERKRSTQYEYSAHMVKVLARGTINLIENHDKENFLYFHDTYAHPSLVLKLDNVVLMGLNAKYAIFCVCNNDICTLDTSIGPFAWVNTFIAANKLIFLPI